MRILVNKEIQINLPDDDEIKLLKDFSIFFKQDGDNLNILVQKIDLEYDNMEKVLDIIEYYSIGLVSLTRYSHGRYEILIKE